VLRVLLSALFPLILLLFCACHFHSSPERVEKSCGFDLKPVICVRRKPQLLLGAACSFLGLKFARIRCQFLVYSLPPEGFSDISSVLYIDFCYPDDLNVKMTSGIVQRTKRWRPWAAKCQEHIDIYLLREVSLSSLLSRCLQIDLVDHIFQFFLFRLSRAAHRH